MGKVVVVVGLFSMLMLGCRHGECAGGVLIQVVNETSSTVFVDVALHALGDGGVQMQSVPPDTTQQVFLDTDIGGSPFPPSERISTVAIRDGSSVLYEGAVTTPPFTFDGQTSGACGLATYTFTAAR